MEVFHELKHQRSRYFEEYWKLIKKIDVLPLSRANLVKKVDYLVKTTAYDIKAKRKILDSEMDWAKTELKKREEEFKRAQEKLTNARTIELKTIQGQIITRKRKEMESARTAMRKLSLELKKLNRRIDMLVRGELARKMLEVEGKWAAHTVMVNNDIKRLRKSLQKMTILKNALSWKYAKLSKPEVKKAHKETEKDKKYAKLINEAESARDPKSRMRNLEKRVFRAITRVQKLTQRLDKALALKKSYSTTRKEEHASLKNIIRKSYKVDIEKLIKNHKKCITNIKALIKNDIKQKLVKNSPRRMDSDTGMSPHLAEHRDLMSEAKKTVDRKYGDVNHINHPQNHNSAPKSEKPGFFGRVLSLPSTVWDMGKNAVLAVKNYFW